MPGLFSRLLLGSTRTIAGTVYGTIVVMAAMAAGGPSFEHEPWRLLTIVVVTAVIFWIAHVYAHGLGESIALGRRLDISELETIARRELSILLAVVLPALALLLGAIGVVRDTAAVWLALGVATATLAAQGVRYARVERLGRAGTALAIAVNLGLGLAIVAVKVALAH
ncbi:MAG TPA: hypothetical protein VH420_00195 [Gaiellaceae bacterium]